MRQIKRQILFGISLLLFGLAFAHSCYGDTSRSLVESSWRYENGEIVSSLNASEDEGISTLSITDLPTGATAEGIDVSEHQKKVDWEAVKASGIDFAILRIGFGAPSFGGRLDYQFQRNISECERLGIPYGIYLYSYAWDDSQAEDEASFVIDNLAGHTPQLPVYYDLEDNSIIAEGRQAGIASRASIFCNRITSAGYSVGIYANLYWFNNVLTQRWIAIRRDDGGYEFRSAMDPDAAFDLTSGKTSNGTRAQLYTANGTEAQSWALEAYELPETRADELASQHAGDLADGTYVIRSAKRPSSALEAKGGRTANGTAVSLYDVNGTVAQAWTVTHEGDYVVIRNAKSGRAIDPTGPSSDPGTKLQLWDASGTRPQRWIAIRRDDGGYEFRSAMDPDAAFDLTSGKTSNGTRAQLYTANGTEAQSWLISVSK